MEKKARLKRLRTKDVEWLYPIILGYITKAHDDFIIHGKEDAFEVIATKIVGLVDDIVDGVVIKYGNE